MNKSRNIKVELLRIVSIILVIANHSVLSLYFGNPYKYLPLEAVTLMGVTIFFIITGFFLYNKNDDVQKVYRNYLLRIFMPFSIFCILVIAFEKAITCETSLIEVVKTINILSAIKAYLSGLKSWSCTNWTYLLGHTWYVFDYTVIIVLFPISYHIINKLNKRFVYILCLCFLIFVMFVDWTVPKGLGIYAISRYVPKVVFLSIIGHIFYNEFLPSCRELVVVKFMRLQNVGAKACRARYCLLIFSLLVLFLMLFYAVVRTQFIYDNLTPNSSHFPYYFRQESFLMIVMSLVFMLMFFLIVDIIGERLSHKISLSKRNQISDIILFLSKKTFLVYLIHSELIVIIMNTGIFKLFTNDNLLLQVLLNIVCVILIYLFSVIIAHIIELFNNVILDRFK